MLQMVSSGDRCTDRVLVSPPVLIEMYIETADELVTQSAVTFNC